MDPSAGGGGAASALGHPGVVTGKAPLASRFGGLKRTFPMVSQDFPMKQGLVTACTKGVLTAMERGNSFIDL